VYSLPSPAGWNVIGRVGVELLRRDAIPPMLLSPGDRVKLVKVNADEFETLTRDAMTLSSFRRDHDG
jgi:inhibitor of KinA